MVANSDIFYVNCGINSLITTAMLNNGWINNLLAVMEFTKTIYYHQENPPSEMRMVLTIPVPLPSPKPVCSSSHPFGQSFPPFPCCHVSI
jgi:hypothetical protein